MALRLVDFLRTQKIWLHAPQLVEMNPLVTKIQRHYHREENPFHWLCTLGRGSALDPEYQAQIIYTTWVEDRRMVNSPTVTEVVSELIYDSLTVYHCPDYQDWLRRYFKSRLACNENIDWLKHLHARQLRSCKRLSALVGQENLDLFYRKTPHIKCPDRSIYPVCIFVMTKKSLATVNQKLLQPTFTPCEQSVRETVPVQVQVKVSA